MANNNPATSDREGMGAYLKGVRKEMGKVVWPTKKELGTYALVVFGMCLAFALGFWLIDMGVLAALRSILGITLN